MGGTLEKQNLEKEPDLDEVDQNGSTGNKNKNNKNKNQSIEESTKSLKKIENKSQIKRNGVPKKKKNDKVSIFAKDK